MSGECYFCEKQVPIGGFTIVDSQGVVVCICEDCVQEMFLILTPAQQKSLANQHAEVPAD